MSIPLSELLELVGPLDDSEGENTARHRFRNYLKQKVIEVSQLRNYIVECLEKSGTQYSRALQDLINHLGHFLEFEVTYGRYQGVQGQNGFDGHWISSKEGFHIVVEVKTSEVYPIKTSALVGYIDDLISDGEIPSWNHALGVYIVGRLDDDIRQIESRIVAEKRTHELRTIFVKSLLSLAEIKNSYGLTHKDVLSVLLPSGPRIDSVVDLMELVVRKSKIEEWEQPEALPVEEMLEAVTDVEQEEDDLLEQPHSPNCQLREKPTIAKEYYFFILKALDEVGGLAKKQNLLVQVEQLMKGTLKEVDYQPQPYENRKNNLRWHNSFSRAGQQMVKDGRLRNDSQIGFWEISDAGHQFLSQETTDVS